MTGLRPRQTLLLFVLIAGISCSARASELEAADRLVGLFGCTHIGKATLPPIDVLIDSSRSMKGFLHAERGGRYRKIIEKLIDTVGHEVTFRRLSSPYAAPIRQDRSVYDPELYSTNDTPLDKAFDFARDRPDSITVLISDLEHSTTTGDLREASRALAVAITTKKYAALVGIRSAFSEQESPSCSPNCQTQRRRYFYVLALSKTPGALQRFVRMTGIDQFAFDDAGAAVHGAPLFFSDRPAVEITSIEIEGDRNRGPWDEYRDTARVACAETRIDRLQSSVTYRDVWPRHPLALRVGFRVHSPIQNFSWTAPKIEKIVRPVWRTPRSITTDVVTHFAKGEAFASGAPQSIRIEYSFQQPTPTTWDVYRIWFSSDPDNFEVPKWVAKWNEQVPASEDATPAVAALVRVMVRDVTQKIPLLEHFIAIGRN